MMRLMLGRNNEPYLLVSVDDDYNLADFKFYVVNGGWYGRYQFGRITVLGCPSGEFSSLDPVEILCGDQPRLRGEYQEVFNNFDNPDYIGLELVKFESAIPDDDIPF